MTRNERDVDYAAHARTRRERKREATEPFLTGFSIDSDLGKLPRSEQTKTSRHQRVRPDRQLELLPLTGSERRRLLKHRKRPGQARPHCQGLS
jgi:hypothetical protein